jgi:hypothetical protein
MVKSTNGPVAAVGQQAPHGVTRNALIQPVSCREVSLACGSPSCG